MRNSSELSSPVRSRRKAACGFQVCPAHSPTWPRYTSSHQTCVDRITTMLKGRNMLGTETEHGSTSSSFGHLASSGMQLLSSPVYCSTHMEEMRVAVSSALHPCSLPFQLLLVRYWSSTAHAYDNHPLAIIPACICSVSSVSCSL